MQFESLINLSQKIQFTIYKDVHIWWLCDFVGGVNYFNILFCVDYFYHLLLMTKPTKISTHKIPNIEYSIPKWCGIYKSKAIILACYRLRIGMVSLQPTEIINRKSIMKRLVFCCFQVTRPNHSTAIFL